MIGGRAGVAVIQSHQQLTGANKLVVFHRHLGDEPGDMGRDRRHVTADIGVVGALEEAVDGPPVVAVPRHSESKNAGKAEQEQLLECQSRLHPFFSRCTPFCQRVHDELPTLKSICTL
jgi:hypothetical protein